MYRKWTLNFCLIAVLGLGCSSMARADDFYFGAAAQLATAEYQGDSTSDTDHSLTLGYIFVDSNLLILSVELSKYGLGNFSDNGNEFESDAVALGVMAALPLGSFIELYGKLGVAAVDVEINGSNFDGDENYRGFGLGFDFFDTVDLFVEYLEFDNEIDSRLLGMGLRIDF